MRPVPGFKEAGVLHKHATPVAAPDSLEASINKLRPSFLFADRCGDDVVQKYKQDLLALSKHFEVRTSTSNTMVSQWDAEYLLFVFPVSLLRPVSGAAFPGHPSERRQKAHNGSLDFVRFEPLEFMRYLPARVEGNVGGSLPLVPAARNLTLKWDALCGQEAACRHSVDRNTAGNVHAAEVTEAAAKLYNKLMHGH